MSSEKKRALITGITGQDGSYLAEMLLYKGWEVHGTIRRSSTFNTQRINHLYKDRHEENVNLFLHYADLTDFNNIDKLIKKIEPDHIYHLAAQSHVKVSFELPEYTGIATGIATTSILEAIRKVDSDAKFYQASSSEMFGSALPPQKEDTPMNPQSPYAIAKLYAYWMTKSYRDAYGIFASNGILFNHESPRRGEIFVTRKITRGLAAIIAKKQEYLYLGNLDSKRDWGYAPEFVEGMHAILNHTKPDDFVLATGKSISVREFLKYSFEYVGLNFQDYVKIDPNYYRPSEVDYLLGDPSKAEQDLGWKTNVNIEMLAKIMVDYDMAKYGLESPGEGVGYLKNSNLSWTNNELTEG